MAISRRQMIAITSGAASAVLLESCLRSLRSGAQTSQSTAGFGPLRPDPDGILDLPDGFRYRIISQAGQRMDDGHRVPGAFDGMGAFQAPDDHVILIRNHELLPGDRLGLTADEASVYDARCKGGTTTLLVAPDHTVVQQFTSLAGTSRNCAGGTTPWQSWISCEEITTTPALNRVGNPENVDKAHGYNFEVPADATAAIHPEPLVAMGRFRHEAIAVDPRTGIVYQTEDQNDGLFYRFIPNEPGQLGAGGRLEALMISDAPQTVTHRRFPVNQPVSVEWVPIEEVDPADDTVRYEGQQKGAALFSRGEGICYSDGHFYFTCTNGGDIPNGQVWKYTPDVTDSNAAASEYTGGILELLVQPNNPRVLDYPDNIIMAPWGDLLLCEDGAGEQFMVGLTPEGQLYPFARNALNGAEFAGICSLPGRTTLFLNIYSPGLTLAVWNDTSRY
ncbi:MAG: alkaline phosphatase PhoX [Cyanobacteria bacterium P01_A01_bin.37]